MVCVRTETLASAAGTTTIAVVGTQRSAGCTTLATNMANVFGSSGSDVVLMDADTLHSGLSDVFESHVTGLSSLIASERTCDGSHRTAHRSELPDDRESSVQVVGIGGAAELRTVTESHLFKAAYVVVLAIPRRGQRRKSLKLVVSQFDQAGARHLSDLMPTTRGSRSS